MKKHIKTIALGLIPLAFGSFMNYAWGLPVPQILWTILELLFFAGWGWLAYRITKKGDRAMGIAVRMNAIGLIMLILVLIQELAVGQYWLNLFGLLPQFYFLSCLRPVYWLIDTVYGWISRAPAGSVLATRVWAAELLEFILMIAATYIGSRRKQNG